MNPAMGPSKRFWISGLYNSVRYRLANAFGRSGVDRATTAAVVTAIAALLSTGILVYSVIFHKDVDNEARSSVMATAANLAKTTATLIEHTNRLEAEMNTSKASSSKLEIRISNLEEGITILQRELQELKLLQQFQHISK
jgi:hypothetical protein